MFGNHFYFKRIRTAVATFGSLFNNIYILRQDASDKVISQVKVPLSYAPKRSFLARLNSMENGEDIERLVAVKLPRMSFEITNISRNSTIQLPKLNNIIKTLNPTSNTKRRKLYTGVPYELSFQLNIYAKNQDDCLQIVEQILPYFNPSYTVGVKPFSDLEFQEDVPISLESVAMQDDYEGSIEQRRTIIYTLDFSMVISLYGPETRGSIIREANINLFNLVGDSDNFIHRIKITPDPIGVSPDSDYGFNVSYLDTEATILGSILDSDSDGSLITVKRGDLRTLLFSGII